MGAADRFAEDHSVDLDFLQDAGRHGRAKLTRYTHDLPDEIRAFDRQFHDGGEARPFFHNHAQEEAFMYVKHAHMLVFTWRL